MATKDVARKPSPEMQRFLAAASVQEAVNPEQIAAEIAERILKETDVDKILGRSGAITASDVLGQTLVLRAVRFNKSTQGDAGPDFYALLDCVDVNGEAITVTCGARNVMVQAWRLQDVEALPLKVVIRESQTPTASGGRPMWLEAAP